MALNLQIQIAPMGERLDRGAEKHASGARFPRA